MSATATVLSLILSLHSLGCICAEEVILFAGAISGSRSMASRSVTGWFTRWGRTGFLTTFSETTISSMWAAWWESRFLTAVEVGADGVAREMKEFVVAEGRKQKALEVAAARRMPKACSFGDWKKAEVV